MELLNRVVSSNVTVNAFVTRTNSWMRLLVKRILPRQTFELYTYGILGVVAEYGGRTLKRRK